MAPLHVDVQPGWHAGTRVTFVGEHDAAPGGWEVCVVVRQAPHPRFDREGADLVFRAVVSRAQVAHNTPPLLALIGHAASLTPY